MKSKQKDPAFLLYSSDFLSGTMLMTNEQKGKYITLLCLQHQQGHIRASDLKNVSGGDRQVIKKFKRDEDGLFYNEKLEAVIAERKEFREKQRIKANIRWGNIPEMPDIGNAGAFPVENEDADTNADTDSEGECGGELDRSLKGFAEHREALGRPLSERGLKLLKARLCKLAKTDAEKAAVLNQSVMNGWSGVFPLRDGRETVKNNAESLKYIQRDNKGKDFSCLCANFRDED